MISQDPTDTSATPPASTSPTSAGGLPSGPAVATNPYDVDKLLGAAPDLKAAFAPAPVVGSFVPNTGAASGFGMGHVATADDLRAHQQAHDAALEYLQMSQHIHQLHNDTQGHIDTADALNSLAGFDPTHPNAAQQIAQARAKFSNARPEAFQFAEKLLEQHQSAQDRMAEQRNAAALAEAKPSALGNLPAGIQTTLKTNKISPEDWYNGPANAGVLVGNKFTQKNENEGATHIQIQVPDPNSTSGGTIKRTVPINTYYDVKKAIDSSRLRAGIPPTAAATGPRAPSPEFQATEARFNTPPQLSSIDHSAAVTWANNNPTDPRSAKILALNQGK